MRSGESEAVTYLYDPDVVLEHARSLLADAEQSAVVSIHEAFLEAVLQELVAARERDVLVVLLLYDCHTVVDPVLDFEPVATIARQTDRSVPMYCVVDDLHGLYADPLLLVENDPDHRASVVHNYDLAYALYGQFVGNHWRAGQEVYRHGPPSLPVQVDNFRELVLHATGLIRQANPIVATADLVAWEDRDAIEGPVVEATQGLLSTTEARVSLQSTLVLRTEAGRTTVGGPGAYLEDYNAEGGRLRSI